MHVSVSVCMFVCVYVCGVYMCIYVCVRVESGVCVRVVSVVCVCAYMCICVSRVCLCVVCVVCTDVRRRRESSFLTSDFAVDVLAIILPPNLRSGLSQHEFSFMGFILNTFKK